MSVSPRPKVKVSRRCQGQVHPPYTMFHCRFQVKSVLVGQRWFRYAPSPSSYHAESLSETVTQEPLFL